MSSTTRRPPWYSSFFWRIALSFVALVVLVLAGQSVMLSYLLSRQRGPFAPDNPNAGAAAVAAAVGRALAADSAAALDGLLPADAGRRRAYVVLSDGRVVSNGPAPLSTALRQQVDAVLRGAVPAVSDDDAATGPVVTAPVQVAGQLRGLVVFPPPPRRGLPGQVADLLSLPATLMLVGAAALAAVVIFAPARRRLHALEQAATRFGAGDLDARAAVDGRDEIANVAAAFNSMAAELAQRTSALQTANARRRQMLADVSHELRTPLTAMVGYLDTLALHGAALDDDRRQHYLETLRREAGRLSRMVEDLLDLARHEQGASSFAPRVCAVDRLFDHVRRRFEQQAAQGSVAIEVRVGAEADQIVADPDRLEQVISNLVANALRHTPPGGTVAMTARLEAGGAALTVEDSGEGLPAEHAAHVFERFYKADSARTGGSGSGLGLSIVKAIVERHGGSVAVSSRPGRTVFTVWLPETPPAAAQSSTSANL